MKRLRYEYLRHESLKYKILLKEHLSLKKALILIGFTVGLVLLPSYIGFYANRSESLPFKVFLVLKKVTPHKGNYAVFTHSWFQKDLIKQVMGVEGDNVRIAPDKTIWVAGQKIGALMSTTSSGTQLTPLKFSGFIPEGYVFVASPHERSFDSRYEEMGLLKIEDLKGRAIPLF